MFSKMQSGSMLLLFLSLLTPSLCQSSTQSEANSHAPTIVTTAATAATTLRSTITRAASASNNAQTTVSLLFGDDDFEGSVIAADATATTYKLQCSNNGDCKILGFNAPNQATVFQGPSTAGAAATVSGLTANIGCVLSGTVPSSCSITVTTGIFSVVTPTDLSNLAKSFEPVRITAGVEKLAAATRAASSAATATTTRGANAAALDWAAAAKVGASAAGVAFMGAVGVLI